MQLMGAARFIIIPTEWYEGHPRTAVEAFARGLPIIASRIGAMAEMIEDGVSGLSFAPGDAAGSPKKIRWALEHPDRMADMGARGRTIYERHYTASKNYPQMIGIYRRVVAAQTAPVLQLAV